MNPLFFKIKVFGKTINDEPTRFYTPEIMERLEEAAREEFMYGDFYSQQTSDDNRE